MVDTSSAYVKPIVMLEVSSRSLIEPTGKARVKSMIEREFANIDTDVADSYIRTALPEKTFLEKVFLLHEMFVTTRCQRAERKSRHLYDIERMMDKETADFFFVYLPAGVFIFVPKAYGIMNNLTNTMVEYKDSAVRLLIDKNS